MIHHEVVGAFARSEIVLAAVRRFLAGALP